MSEQPLAGWRIALTRVPERSRLLAERIPKLGGRALILPVVEIAPCPNPLAARALLAQVDAVQLAIFTSVPAVHHTLRLLAESGQSWPESIVTVAIGPATAQAVRAEGLGEPALPEQFNSESVLQMPELLDCEGHKVLIPVAPGGRHVLHRELTHRGATVLSPTVYQRALAVETSLDLQQALTDPGSLMIAATSASIVTNLFKLAGPFEQAARETPWVVASARIAQTAHSMGIKRVQISVAADDGSMLVAMSELARSLA